MRKYLFLLLLVIMPLQFAWSAASGYCRHESGSGPSHFGHHVHQMHGAFGEQAQDMKIKIGSDGDDDCLSCHPSVAHVAAEPSAQIASFFTTLPPAFRPPAYRSPVPLGLERPARQLAL